MKKVLLLSHASSLGGAQKCLELLARGLCSTDYRPIVVFPSPGPLEIRLRSIGIQTEVLPMEYWVGMPYHWRRFARGLKTRVEGLCRIIREEDIRLAFTNTSVIVEGALAAKICGIPHVWHVLEMLSQDPAFSPFFELSTLYRLMDSLSDRFVAVSAAVRDEISMEIPPDKIRVIHTGIEPLEGEKIKSRANILAELGVAEDVPLVCFAGDLCERKGVVDLAETAFEVSLHLPNVLFLIVGKDGGEQDRLLRKIRDLRIESRFRFLGFRQDALSIISSSDVFVLPSLADPLPVVVLEAMMLGKPVVATRSGGCEEMILDGENGYLVPIRDPQFMADRLRTLLLDPSLITRMGMKSAQIAGDSFTLGNAISETTALFNEVLRDVQDERVCALGDVSTILLEAMAQSRIQV